ncbi:MAG: DUF433 domain-containing protein [Dehalococcoidia bacterium]|nr:DUF433 domain-containing protein [Dehalococcoidia bacterium]
MTMNQELLSRITSRPDVFGGKPIIRDMRVSVELILSLLTQGVTPDAILDDYPDLELDDIRACTAYAHAVIAGDSLAAVSVANS